MNRTRIDNKSGAFSLPLCFAFLMLFCMEGSTPASKCCAEETASPVVFARDIQPIFEEHCLKCHSDGIRKGEFSLSTSQDLRDNAYAVPQDDPASSHLISLLTPSKDEPPQMPKEGEPLSAEQVSLITRWISQGATWPEELVLREKSKADATWWSLQPLANAEPPSPEAIPERWQTNPVDRYVFEKLAEKNLTPSPPADRRTLIRRATYDLTGLPPTPAEVTAFLEDTDPLAYDKLIDRLLSSPRYGERWGRHWLDVVRFGESIGYERNVIINDLWPFRDYVIRSLNEDKPMDQFIREHLAGDVFAESFAEGKLGSAFLVAGPYDDVNNQDAEQAAQIRANTIDEIIRATSEAFLGLTIGCARCHDHKFDPILQSDYYALYATFSGIRHGSQPMASQAEISAHEAKAKALQDRRNAARKKQDDLKKAILARAEEHSEDYEKLWPRNAVSRSETKETFPPVEAKWIRLISEGLDSEIDNTSKFGIDEFEVWSADPDPVNVALSSNGAKAYGKARENPDFPGSYSAQLAIDGKVGARFLAQGGDLTIEFAQPAHIGRVVFSSARDEAMPDNPKFAFVAEYRLEVSDDGKTWVEVANSHDRKPVNAAHRQKRMFELEATDTEKLELAQLQAEINQANQENSQLAPLPTVWIGSRVAADAKGPFHIFLGGSPQRKGAEVIPSSLAVMNEVVPEYSLESAVPESERRRQLADWIVHPQNSLTARVLANRIWHYHFGTGIVSTPSDFGYMGEKPSHPELLDWLAGELHRQNWQLKSLHKLLMTSQTYQQSSQMREDAAKIDGDARLLWRFPPRRLSAEEVRDTMLTVSGKLDLTPGGPGFRLYKYIQDNVATYTPLDEHGPETYRRAIYHQNARASVVDVMTDFDQPDCAFSTPRRSATTTPLQALTMLNHQFSLDMAHFFAERLKRDAGEDTNAQVNRAFQLCFGREPTETELKSCSQLAEDYSLSALCRVLLNTSEMIYIE